MSQHRLTRRTLLTTAAAAGTGAILAAPAIIPAAALGKDGAVAPSERIVMGGIGIGIGGRGRADLEWLLRSPEVQFVAVCDVRKDNRDKAKAMVDQKYGNTDCTLHTDLRAFCRDRDDIDAMLIATGDRWHAHAAILAMQHGKDVYCEKPGTMTVAEGQQLVKVAEETGRVFQTGAQRLSQPNFIYPTELARHGKLGEIRTVRAHLWPRVKDVTHNTHLPAQPEPPKDVLDWNLWLGPPPQRAYNAGYINGCGAWGIYWDLAAGVAGWGSHTFIQCQFAIGAEHASPVKYRFPGNKSGDGMVCTFANGVDMVVQLEGWRGSCGVKFEGTDGWASVADGYVRADVHDNAILRDMQKTLDDYKHRSGRSLSHPQDFLDCARSRRTPIAGPVPMHRSMTTCHAINICLALGRDLEWDPKSERFVGDDEANTMLSRPVRDPWQA